MYRIFFFRPSVNGYLGCFHVLVIVNAAAVNIGCMYLQILVFSWYMPRSGISRSYGSSVLSFLTFYFILVYSQLTVLWLIVSGGQQGALAIPIPVSILSQTPLPSRLPSNFPQSSMCYPVGSYGLSIQNITVWTCQSQTPWLPFPLILSSGSHEFLL